MKTRSNSLVDLAYETSRMLRRYTATSDAAHSLNMLRSHALTFIRETPDVTMKELADMLRISASSATSFVDRLVEEGWVKRVPDRKNRKLVHLRVTKTGEKILAQCTAKRRQTLSRIVALIPAEDQRHLHRILQHLMAVLPQSSSCPSPVSHD